MNLLTPYLHPRRALRALLNENELQARISALLEEQEKKNAEQATFAESLQADKEKAQRVAEEANRRADLLRHNCERLEQRLAKNEHECESLRAELVEEREEARLAMEEIGLRLDTVDKLRATYENRISHLKHALSDARARMKTFQDYGALAEMELIELDENKSVTPPRSGPGDTTSDEMDSSDWLMSLG